MAGVILNSVAFPDAKMEEQKTIRKFLLFGGEIDSTEYDSKTDVYEKIKKEPLQLRVIQNYPNVN